MRLFFRYHVIELRKKWVAAKLRSNMINIIYDRSKQSRVRKYFRPLGGAELEFSGRGFLSWTKRFYLVYLVNAFKSSNPSYHGDVRFDSKGWKRTIKILDLNKVTRKLRESLVLKRYLLCNRKANVWETNDCFFF